MALKKKNNIFPPRGIETSISTAGCVSTFPTLYIKMIMYGRPRGPTIVVLFEISVHYNNFLAFLILSLNINFFVK